MNQFKQINERLQVLIHKLDEKFGVGAFLMQTCFGPNLITIKSAADERVVFFIRTANQHKDCYSVVVGIPRSAGEECAVPLKHVVDRENVPLEEAVKIFAKYRKL